MRRTKCGRDELRRKSQFCEHFHHIGFKWQPHWLIDAYYFRIWYFLYNRPISLFNLTVFVCVYECLRSYIPFDLLAILIFLRRFLLCIFPYFQSRAYFFSQIFLLCVCVRQQWIIFLFIEVTFFAKSIL